MGRSGISQNPWGTFKVYEAQLQNMKYSHTKTYKTQITWGV